MEFLHLTKLGWSPLQARVIAEGMVMPWRDEWAARCKDWCSAHERSGTEGEAMFLTYLLQNVFQPIGLKLKAAETEQQAQDALKDFWILVRQQGNLGR